jgi:hypothetical protein
MIAGVDGETGWISGLGGTAYHPSKVDEDG